MVTRQNPYATPAAEAPVVAQLIHDEQGLAVEYENTLSDSIAFSLFHHTQSRYGRRQVLTARLVLLLAILIVAIITVRDASSLRHGQVLIAIFAGVALATWVLYPAVLRFRLTRALRHMYADGRHRPFDGPRRLTLSPEYLIYATPQLQTVVRWSAVERAVTSDTYLFIYLTSVSAVTVPRKAFESIEAFDSFASRARSLIDQAVGGK